MKYLISAAIALSLLGSTAAVAQSDRQDRPNRDFPHWSRGDRLSPEYRSDQYVVSDWRGNHLRQPPRGYHWVRRDNQYILVAITSGLILDAILNSK